MVCLYMIEGPLAKLSGKFRIEQQSRESIGKSDFVIYINNEPATSDELPHRADVCSDEGPSHRGSFQQKDRHGFCA